MTKPGNKTFVKITNRDIYEQIKELIIHVRVTNGKVKLNRWIAGTALALVLMTIPLIFTIAVKALG